MPTLTHAACRKANPSSWLTAAALLVATIGLPSYAKEAPPKPQPALADIVKASKASDWRDLDLQNTLYLELPAGRVVIELAPRYAPNHVANIKALVREGYFDGLVILRAQDNWVVQWGDPSEKRPIKTGKATLKAEFSTAIAKDIPFTALPDLDTYAPAVGYSNGLPAARDPQSGNTWLTHCYGMVGAGRDNDADSGGGTELYVVIGHSPRHLDRNVTLVGRVMQGMELLSTLPRGTAALGFYDKPEQYVPIKSIRVAADVPQSERSHLEIIRTDTPTFKAIVESQRFRGGDWYKFAAGHVEVCNVPIPVREKK
ncbi:MAG: peptidylprolyl isomerase [Burkholderiaceae bacterium]|nr:peptidylprolyl isomerase [Burkholderiaceae bacterium]